MTSSWSSEDRAHKELIEKEEEQEAYRVLSRHPLCDWTDDYGIIRRGWGKHLIALAKAYVRARKSEEGGEP